MDQATETALRDCTWAPTREAWISRKSWRDSPPPMSSATTPIWCAPRRPTICPTDDRGRSPATRSDAPPATPFSASGVAAAIRAVQAGGIG